MNIIVIKFGRWVGRGLRCSSKIHHGSPTISEKNFSFHQDFMASTHNDFLQGQMDRCQFYWPNLSGETWLSK